MNFANSHLGKLRQLVGNRLLLVPATRVVINNKLGEVLLDYRPDFRVWALPGGIVEPNEGATSSALREVEEESGLRLSNLKPFGLATEPSWETVQFCNGDVVQSFTVLFATSEYRGNPAPRDGESGGYGWFDPAQAPTMMPNHRRSLDGWLTWKDTGSFQML